MLNSVDVVIVSISLLIVFAIAIVSFLKTKKSDDRASSFFLAHKSMPWWLIASSLFASNIGTEHFVGQAGTAAETGLAVGIVEWSIAYVVVLLGWIFAPIYLKNNLTTTIQFIEKRFNKYCRKLLVIVTLAIYSLSKIATCLYAGSIVLQVLLDLNMWQSIPIITIGTALYSMGGGLKAVMWTDGFQMLVFVFGGIIGSILSLKLVGGISGLFNIYKSVGLEYNTHLLRPYNDRDFPWIGCLIGNPLVSIWYWCVDQEMAQRVLGAASLDDARLGTSLAGLLKILPIFIIVFPGMVSRALYELCKADPSHELHSMWCSFDMSDPQMSAYAYPLLVLHEFPHGIKGLMVAVFLSAMMSSLSSVFNSTATILTYDIYKNIFVHNQNHNPPDHLLMIGRLSTIFIALITLAWLPVIQTAQRGLYIVGMEALSHLATPISALYISGLFFNYASPLGASIGFTIGVLISIIRLTLYLLYQNICDQQCYGHFQELTLSNWVICINFYYFAIILFSLTFFMIYLFTFLSNLYLKNISSVNVEEIDTIENLVSNDFQHQETEIEPLESNQMDTSMSINFKKSISNKKYWSSVFLSVSTVISITILIIYFR